MQTISFIIFWDFAMFYQNFLSAQVKWWAIINYKHGIYELPHKLPNDLTLKDLRKLGNIRKLSKPDRMIAPETKGPRFESGRQPCAEARSPQQSPGQCPSAREAGGSGSDELKKCPPPFPAVLLFVNGCERKPRQKKKW